MKAVVLLSGGLDSATLLAHLLAAGHDCRALSVDYGQRHRRELDAAASVARHFGAPHEVVALPASLLAGSALTTGGGPVPHGHYADPTMRATVVPARNTVLLALAAAVAVREGCGAVALANHAGDHPVYPDCRPEFVAAFAGVLALCDYEPVGLLAPFAARSKADVVRRGAELAVPFGLTWSCYEGAALHCGKCGTCVERLEAFRVASVDDPTEYAG